MCLYPKYITNNRYKNNKKNGGNIPAIIDNRVLIIPAPCGNCIECRRKKAREWQIRLLEEIKRPEQYGYFVTLTFSNQSIKELSTLTDTKGYLLDNQIATIATRRFLERWRKTHQTSLRHWLITELGHNGTHNIHLHGILWFNNKADILKLDEHWQYGYTWKGAPIYRNNKITDYKNYVNEATIGYIVKYVTKRDDQYTEYKPKILTSPGIGNNYLTDEANRKKHQFNYEQTKNTYHTTTGNKVALPKYYRDRLYDDQEREILRLIQEDEKTRWVLGIPTDTSKDLTEYHNQLQIARQKNKRLGYGTDRINYEIKKQEQELRTKMQLSRINKGGILPPLTPLKY